jgi:hypothetical protein
LALISHLGLRSDIHDALIPSLIHLTWTTRSTLPIFLLLLLSLLILPALLILPLRPIILTLGLLPFLLSHPRVLPLLSHLLSPSSAEHKHILSSLSRTIDNIRLSPHHIDQLSFNDGWGLKEVEVWENERWLSGSAWKNGSANLKVGERKGWTRGRDGWSDDVAGGGSVRFGFLVYCSGGRQDGLLTTCDAGSRDLKFPLDPGWSFVESEDWRVDILEPLSDPGASSLSSLSPSPLYTND